MKFAAAPHRAAAIKFDRKENKSNKALQRYLPLTHWVKLEACNNLCNKAANIIIGLSKHHINFYIFNCVSFKLFILPNAEQMKSDVLWMCICFSYTYIAFPMGPESLQCSHLPSSCLPGLHIAFSFLPQDLTSQAANSFAGFYITAHVEQKHQRTH